MRIPSQSSEAEDDRMSWKFQEFALIKIIETLFTEVAIP